MEHISEYTVTEELEEERLDAVIASLSEGQSRSYLKALIKDGSVLLNEKETLYDLFSLKKSSPIFFLKIYPWIFSMKMRMCWWSINRREW